MAGIKMVHVPYKGSGQATTDLLAGQVSLSMPGTAGMVGHIKNGKLRAFGRDRGPTRSPQLPDVPTLKESGYPGLRGLCLARSAGAQGARPTRSCSA